MLAGDRKIRTRTFIIVVIIAILVLPPLVGPLFFPWSPINCRHEEINIKTGQVRISRDLWFVRISERIEDTPFTLALEGEIVDVADIEAWKPVNTFSPGYRNSPHYTFHGAWGQMRELEMISSQRNFSPERKKQVVKDILTLWQQAGVCSGADELLRELIESNFRTID